MKFTQAFGIFLSVLFLSSAVFANEPLEIEISLAGQTPFQTIDTAYLNIILRNVGTVPINIEGYSGSIHYEDCPDQSACKSIIFAQCEEDCLILGANEEKSIASYDFTPASSYGEEASGVYTILASAKGVYDDNRGLVFSTSKKIELSVFKPTPFVSQDDDPFLGNPDAKVRLIEFGDFSTPFSKQFHDETLPLIIENFVQSGEVKYIFRNFPLGAFPYDYPSAFASECANMQTKYWEYHYLLFSNVNSFSDENFVMWAENVGMNPLVFQDCISSDEVKKEIGNDVNDGIAAGVSGVPTFFIQNVECETQELIVGAASFSHFASSLTDFLNEDCSTIGGDLSIGIFGGSQEFNKIKLVFGVSNNGNLDINYHYLISVTNPACEGGEKCIHYFPSCDFNSECFSLGPGEFGQHNFSFNPTIIFEDFHHGYLQINVGIISVNDVDQTNNNSYLTFNYLEPEICDDAIDNDGNGKADCSDFPACAEFCFEELNKKIRTQQIQLDELDKKNDRLENQLSVLEDVLNDFILRISNLLCEQANICSQRS
jgi:protein-disulfide isomerase